MDVFDNFGSLDGLIQVIYHSTSCFVLTSNVEIAAWVIELGLVGSSGKWWRGSWSKTNVLKFANQASDVTEKSLEIFASQLSNYIVAGELSITDWSDQNESNLTLNINPTGGSPIEIDLKPLPSTEGAARATNILKAVALQAQSRGCRLFGVQAPPSPVFLSKPSNPASKQESAQLVESSQVASTSKSKLAPKKVQEQKELQLAQERIKRLENEVNLVKQAAIAREIDAAPKHAAPKPPKGASRANPTRQKRKIVEAEFESD